MLVKMIHLICGLYTIEMSQWLNEKLDRLHSAWVKNNLKSCAPSVFIPRYTRIIGANFISLGDNTYIFGHCVIEAVSEYMNQKFSPQIVIGSGCSIGEYSHITCINRIIIGNGVLTGRRVLLSDNDHGHFTKEELVIPPSYRKIVSKGPIIIEDNVWIGEGASIIGNVRIGKGSVVAANAVVTKDVPPYCLVAGVPAKIIKKV